MTRAFAILSGNGEILAETVYPHAKGCKVNWLATNTSFLPTIAMSDDAIEDAFKALAPDRRVSVVEVEITIVAPETVS